MSLRFVVIVMGVGVASYCFYKHLQGLDARIQHEVDEALWQESMEHAKAVLAKHERSLEQQADDLRAELEEVEFEAQERWWQDMEPTLADIRDLPEIEPARDFGW